MEVFDVPAADRPAHYELIRQRSVTAALRSGMTPSEADDLSAKLIKAVEIAVRILEKRGSKGQLS